MSKTKNRLDFDNIEIGDVLFNTFSGTKLYYFIYDKTKTRIYYSCYEFRESGFGVYSRSDKDRESFKASLLSDGSTHAPKGDLVKQLLIAQDIKDITQKNWFIP